MNRIILLILGFLILAIGVGGDWDVQKFAFSQDPLKTQEDIKEIREAVMKLQRLIKEKEAKGEDVSKAIEMDRQSIQAMDAGKTKECLRLLTEAIALLSEGKEEVNKKKGLKTPSDQLIEKPKSQEQIMESSPFGFHATCDSPSLDSCEPFNDIQKIGAKWIRLSGAGGLTWDAIELEKGNYDWSRTDYLFNQVKKEGLALIVTVTAINRFYTNLHNPKFIPNNWLAHERFLRTAVERYNGIVDYWQIENEVDNIGFWRDSPENYALLLKKSYKIIKNVNPHAKVVIAGATGPAGIPFYWRIFSALDRMKEKSTDKFFDIFDLHWYENWKYGPISTLTDTKTKILLKTYIQRINEKFLEFGYKGASIWITEVGVWSDPIPHEDSRQAKNEKNQAQYLFKVYVNSLANGVEKIFWFTLRDNARMGKDIVKFGLITNPVHGQGLSYKKLGYYTYKLLTEKLQESLWDEIQHIRENDGIYIYKFKKGDKSIWVAWNDNMKEKQVTISGIASNQLIITNAVPKYKSGKDITDYSTAFETKTQSVNDNKMKIILEDIPLIMEEK